MKYTSLDLFAGAGGLTEGITNAGFTSLLAIEKDNDASKTFAYNHPDVPIITANISTISNSTIRDIVGNDLTMVTGGPPCQGFSMAGKRLSADPRNQLFKEFVRIVDATQPKVFLFENVPGLVSMSNGEILKAIISEFQSIGYNCIYKILNSADFGVPQIRNRLIILGSRDNLDLGFPNPTSMHHISVWQAISNLPIVLAGGGEEEIDTTYMYKDQYQEIISGKTNMLYNHRATNHSQKIIDRYNLISEGQNNSVVPAKYRTKKINLFRLDSALPSKTITCHFRSDLIHPKYPRGLTVREAARLQSFDDDYKFFGNLTTRAKYLTQDEQVGNAVPPLLAQELATHIITKL
jgi:DNA (cytosine-5)-methyltransferase 1